MKKTQQEARKVLGAIQVIQDQAANTFKQMTDSNIAAVKDVQEQVQARMEKLSEQIEGFDFGDAPEHLEEENSELEALDIELENLLGDLECACDGVEVSFTDAIGGELVAR